MTQPFQPGSPWRRAPLFIARVDAEKLNVFRWSTPSGLAGRVN